jgi:hypothetical protein
LEEYLETAYLQVLSPESVDVAAVTQTVVDQEVDDREDVVIGR